jgi:hypothetical protein
LDENTRSSHEERTEKEKDKEKKGKTERSAAEERTVEKRRVFTRLSSCCYVVIQFSFLQGVLQLFLPNYATIILTVEEFISSSGTTVNVRKEQPVGET